jgi:arylsulfatase A-like enzyme
MISLRKCFAPLFAAALCLGFACNGEAGGLDRTTNIVFILADDLGIMDVGAYATRLSDTTADELYYETPNIDALTENGIAFSQAYANQLCSPTRAAILTARYPGRLGVTTATPTTRTYYNQGMETPEGYSPHDAFAHQDRIEGSLAWNNAHSNTAVSTEIPTIPDVLKTHDCAYLGKWHLGGHGAEGQQPHDHGFEGLAYFDAGGSPYFNWRERWDRKELYYPTTPQEELTVGDSGTNTGEEYLTDDLTVQAIDYLERRAETPDDPFFLYFAHFSVHTPLQAKQETIEYFESKLQRGINGQDNPTYAAMVKHLDDSVGAIMEALEATGLAENTLVLFTSDNGGVEYTNPPATDNYPFKGGKACLYEGGVRVPLVFYQPGRFDQSIWRNMPVNCVDFLPTFADLTGNETPDDIDGESLSPLLGNADVEMTPRTFYWHYPFNVIVKHPDNGHPLTPHSAIRVGDYKLIWDWQGRLELYDIPGDPYELADISTANPELTEQLFTQLKTWLRENVEPRYFPVRNPEYDQTQDARQPLNDFWN